MVLGAVLCWTLFTLSGWTLAAVLLSFVVTLLVVRLRWTHFILGALLSLWTSWWAGPWFWRQS